MKCLKLVELKKCISWVPFRIQMLISTAHLSWSEIGPQQIQNGPQDLIKSITFYHYVKSECPHFSRKIIHLLLPLNTCLIQKKHLIKIFSLCGTNHCDGAQRRITGMINWITQETFIRDRLHLIQKLRSDSFPCLMGDDVQSHERPVIEWHPPTWNEVS